MSDFDRSAINLTPVHRIGHLGISLAAATVRSVNVEFPKAEFARCSQCGRAVARLLDQERWHHVIHGVDGQHVPMQEARS